jgi:DNA ligase-associated metallophosphoesterase
MARELDTTIAGEPMRLYAERALLWPARQRLLIADLHLGKGDVFRRAGIAVPGGGTADDLARLDRVLAASGATSLWVLGDVLHGAAHAAPWRRVFDAWRARHPRLEIAAIGGNHDRALAPAALGIDLLGDAVVDAPFALRHAPIAHRRHVICGHLHPALSLPGLRRRWPAFWLQTAMTVLPAFSAFTGGAGNRVDDEGRFVLCVDDELVPL